MARLLCHLAALVGAVFALALLQVSSAFAATARVNGSVLEYNAAPGEANVMSIVHTVGLDFRITDNGAVITAGPGCLPVQAHVVSCSDSGVLSTLVDVGDLNDVVDGTSGFGAPDHLIGGPGDDTLHSAVGDYVDTLDGNDGNDELLGSSEGDTLNGGAGSDKLFGNGGDDTLNGGPGDDLLNGYIGSDVLNGNEGTDTADYSNSYDVFVPVTVTLDDVANDGGTGAGENDNVRTDVENISGTYGDDTLTGDSDANLLYGYRGNDTLNGGGGDDTLIGGDDSDTLNAEAGNDVLNGENPGAPPGSAPLWSDTFNGGSGIDTATYASHEYYVTVTLDGVANDGGFGENDNVKTDIENLVGTFGPDTLVGDGADNVLDGDGAGGPGADTLRGGGGTDVVTYALRSAPIHADLSGASGTGEDTIGSDVEGLVGGSGDDLLSGNGAANVINGGPGNDVLDGRLGGDVLVGGAGPHDLVSYADRTKSVRVSLDGVANDGESGEGDNAGADVEDVSSGSGSDTLTGNASNNHLEGGTGADTIVGGAGEDTVDYSARNGSVGVYLDGTAASGTSADGPRGARDRIAADVEDAVAGSSDDVLVGNSGPNVLDAGLGDDVLDGGLGPDELRGSEGDDVVDYSRRSTGVLVNLNGAPVSGNAGDGPAAARDRVSEVEGIVGGSGSDMLVGSGRDNVFLGGPGADVFSGLGGIDLVVYADRRKPVRVTLDGVANDGQRSERDNVRKDIEGVLGGSAGDALVGSGAGNVLVGGPGADSLNGLRGVDLLLGGAGADLLTGGRGIDGLQAGPGRDRVQSRDRVVDLVSCGSGRDAVTADAVDSIKRDCEKVDRGRGKKGHALTPELGTSSAPSVVLEQMRWWDSVATELADPRLIALVPR